MSADNASALGTPLALEALIRNLSHALEFIDAQQDGHPSKYARAAIVEKLDDIEQRRIALCERLGVWPHMPEPDRWIALGYALAAREIEFTRNRGRGRPKDDISQNELLVDVIDICNQEFGNASDREWIAILKRSKNVLHPDIAKLVAAAEDSLPSKVSRGRRKRAPKASQRIPLVKK